MILPVITYLLFSLENTIMVTCGNERQYTWDCKDGSVVKSPCSNFRKLEFSSQHPIILATGYLMASLTLLDIPCMCVIHTCRHTYTWIKMLKINAKIMTKINSLSLEGPLHLSFQFWLSTENVLEQGCSEKLWLVSWHLENVVGFTAASCALFWPRYLEHCRNLKDHR